MRYAPLRDLLVLADTGAWGEEDTQNGVSVLRSTNFNGDGTIDFKNLSLRHVEARVRDAKLLQPGDILLEKSGGGPKQPVGRVCLFQGHERPHAFGNFVARLRPCEDILSEFLFYFLYFLHLSGRTTHFQKQTTGIRNLEFKRYLSIEVPVPDRAAQQETVRMINRLLGIRRLRREAQEKARQVGRALFASMFGNATGTTHRFPVEKLGGVLKVRSGQFLPAKNMARDGTFPVYGGNGISGYHSEYLFEQSVVTIGRVGAYCGNVHVTQPQSWVTDNALYVSETFREFDVVFLAEALRSADLNRFASQSGQPLISAGRISAVPIVVPPLALQREFGDRLADVQSILTHQSRSAAAVDQLVSSLMAQVFGSNGAATA